MAMTDGYGRKINYLRLSITDRCNLRCRYCMPEAWVDKTTHGNILRYEELEKVARAAVALGVEKIRITGGEPLVRKGVVDFLGRVKRIAGLRHLVLTTNGVLLPKMAAELKAAGVERLNISLDSLQPEPFRRITRLGELSQVLDGIEAARAAGMTVKINMVVMRGTNEHEILDFVRFAIDRALAVRFIEYMPVLGKEQWPSLIVPGEEILSLVRSRFPLTPLVRGRLAGPAREYAISGTSATVGVITPYSSHFCRECNRIRVTATGMAKGCLFSEQSLDLRPFLGQGDELALRGALRNLIGGKPSEHRIDAEAPLHSPFAMSDVGG
jgi:cyclic pyranopterin phosphate synthase